MLRKKKSRKMRGSKTHGYGSKKKHRGGGSKGGKGYAGSHKHKFIKILKYEPNHFGKLGFVSRRRKDKIINIADLNKLVKDEKELDLTAMGYDKLLGKGEITKPMRIKVAKISKAARSKIESAGGVIIKKVKPEKCRKEE